MTFSMSLSFESASRLLTAVNFEDIELQEDLSYREHPVAILEETKRKTHNKSMKFLKVKWSHHSDRESTWEREGHLRSECPEFFQS